MSTLTPKAARALDESIEHWERLRAKSTLTLEEEEGPYADACPLCAAFDDDDECTDCPISKCTGHDNCGGTPYQEAYAAWHAACERPTFFNMSIWKQCSTAMIDFLKSLREEHNRPAAKATAAVREPGICPRCNESFLDYKDMDLGEDSISYECSCTCGFEGKEHYNLTFAGFTDASDTTGEFI